MLYPIYVHKEKGSVYGASFPDFPGCHAAAFTLQKLPAAAQEAVEAHLFGETEPIATPSSVNDWMQQTEFQDGFWMHVDIDLSTVNASRHSWPTA
ncbi:type II toxin-antitoxin system HicB family antitoxin [Achromobacter sp. JUb104]|uniref:type II toxin-antitoxin system HicB family antitoxin n=1 Tax=Achromobacter sp. JUb104 TaxID=2940590 RepID=UPI002167AB62|nr:type II toxin-antitoxin system HicB family antitoxin [Achromobacter sp. JUb104]MCS3504408.1 putative RNase H-like HicB family nuclease [Achromobacter sp. JUb104]